MKPAPLRSGTAISIDVEIETDGWRDRPDAESCIRRAIETAREMLEDTDGHVVLVLADDATIRELNKHWRGQDKATNVLSFPSAGIAVAQEPHHLGDIVIAYETAAREAAEEGKDFAHHAAHLALHGFLHLLGHDHVDDEAANEMENLEREILARIGIEDPYAGPETGVLTDHA